MLYQAHEIMCHNSNLLCKNSRLTMLKAYHPFINSTPSKPVFRHKNFAEKKRIVFNSYNFKPKNRTNQLNIAYK